MYAFLQSPLTSNTVNDFILLTHVLVMRVPNWSQAWRNSEFPSHLYRAGLADLQQLGVLLIDNIFREESRFSVAFFIWGIY